MLKTSKTKSKSTTTSRTTPRTKLKVKVIKTTTPTTTPTTTVTLLFNGKLKPHRTNSIINKKLFKLHPSILQSSFSQPISTISTTTTTPTQFTTLPTLLLPTTASTSLHSSSSSSDPTLTLSSSSSSPPSSPPSSSASRLTLSSITSSLPHSSSPTSTTTTSSSWLSSFSKSISLPFRTIFNLQQAESPQQQQAESPQQQQAESQLESFIITLHLHQQFHNQFHSLTKPFQHKLLSQSNIFHSTKVQLKDANEHPTSSSNDSNNDITFKFLTSNEFKDAMKPFPSHFQDDLTIPLLLFHSAVEKHYPSKPLEFVTKFIRLNRKIFEQLFQHQIVNEIPSFKDNTTKQSEILEIIFNQYNDITILISKLRDKGCTNKEIGALLRNIYPKHFHGKINVANELLSTDFQFLQQKIRDDNCDYAVSTQTINGYEIFVLRQSFQNQYQKDTIQSITIEILDALNNLEHFGTIMNETQSHFLSLFERDDVQHIIQAHPNDWYSDSKYAHQIFQIFETAYIPLFHHVNYNSALTAHDAATRTTNLNLENEIQSNISQMASYLQNERTNQENHFYNQQIIQPLQDEHISMSYIQNLILCSVEYLKQRKFMNSQSSTDQGDNNNDDDDDNDQKDTNLSLSKEQKTKKNLSLAFKLLTGLSYNNFKRHEHVDSLALHGPHGIGKSYLLLIMFLRDVYKASKDPQNNPKVVILTIDRPNDRNNQFQVEIHLKDNGQIKYLFIRNSLMKKFEHFHPPITSHYYDSPDDLHNSYDHIINPTTFIYNGIEIHLLNNQEHIVHNFPPTTSRTSKIEPLPTENYFENETFIYGGHSPSLLSTPTFIRSFPSYIQTILSLLKSSLYQHRFNHLKLASSSKQQIVKTPNIIHSEIIQSPFYKDLQLISCDDLIHINLFDQWDNGLSINQSPIPLLPNPSICNKIDEIRATTTNEKDSGIQNLVHIQFPAFHYQSTRNCPWLRQTPIQRQFNNTPKISPLQRLVQQAFNLDDNDIKISGYIEQIKQELRLLPYVSSAPHSAMKLYSQLQQTSTTQSTIRDILLGRHDSNPKAQLNHRDFFTRYVPTTFQNVLSLFPNFGQYKITTMTQFSQLSSYFSQLHTFEALITGQVGSLQNIAFRQQIENYYQYYRSNTIQLYFTGDHYDLMSLIYDPTAKYRYYVDTRQRYKFFNHVRTSPRSIESFPISFEDCSSPNQISPIISFPVCDETDYESINEYIASSVQFIYDSFTRHNTRVNVSLSTNGVPNYPTFNMAFIHLNQKSTLDEVIIQIKPLQIITYEKSWSEEFNSTHEHLLQELYSSQTTNKNLKIKFDDWFIISPQSVSSYIREEKFIQPPHKSNIPPGYQITLPFDKNPINFIPQLIQYSPIPSEFTNLKH